MEYIRTLEGDYISAQLIELEKGDPGYDDGWSYELRVLSVKQEDDPIYWNRTNTLEEAKDGLRNILSKIKPNFDVNISSLKSFDSEVLNTQKNYIFKGTGLNIGYIIRKLSKVYVGYIAEPKDRTKDITEEEFNELEDYYVIVNSVTKENLNFVLRSLISVYLNMKRDVDVILEYIDR